MEGSLFGVTRSNDGESRDLPLSNVLRRCQIKRPYGEKMPDLTQIIDTDVTM